MNTAHNPEPEPGTLQTLNGRRVDLFNIRHYPVKAVCRECGEPIEAETFLRSFIHTNPSLATVHYLPSEARNITMTGELMPAHPT